MKTRLTGILIFLILALYIGILKPFAPSLGAQGHLALMAVLIAVGMWVFGGKWLPLSAGSMLILLVLILAGLKFSTVFNGYTGRAIWILIPALFFGFTLTKTGLGKRLAFLVIKLFKPSYLALTISWVIIGILLSVLTPSITVRIAILVPIAAAMAEICRLKFGSRGSGYIVLTAWAMALIPGSAWLTGSLWGPMAIGFFGNILGLENVITFNSWLQAFLVPSALLTAFFILGLYKFVKPAEKLDIDPNSFKKGWEALGPITFAEKATLVILLITFLLLVTAQYTSISDVAICLGAFVLLSVVGVIKPKDIGSGISWDLVIFLGAVMGLSLVFQETGISKFLSNSFLPLISSLAVSHWVILFAALLALFAWRFLDVAQLLPTIPFLVPLLPMLMANFGINPLIMFLLFVMAGNFFFFAYQQPFAILGESLAGQAAWTAGQLRAAGIIYVGACLATLALSIPYWMLVGLIK